MVLHSIGLIPVKDIWLDMSWLGETLPLSLEVKRKSHLSGADCLIWLMQRVFCFVLFCFVLFCFVLFCFVLFCFVCVCFVAFCLLLFGCFRVRFVTTRKYFEEVRMFFSEKR